MPAVIAAVVVPLATGGGFSSSSRLAFAALAALALLLAVATRPAGALDAATRPLVLTLLAVAALTTISAAWTIGEPELALRWGLVIAGYAAIAVAVGSLADAPHKTMQLVAAICLVAFVSALIGLWGVVIRDEPSAYRITGEWRPAGPFEYPTALGYLQLAVALPLLRLMTTARPILAGVGAFALSAAGIVLALSGSRVLIVLALAIAVAAIAAPAFGGARRRIVAGAVAIAAAGAVIAALALGTYAVPFDTGFETGRLAWLIVALAPAAMWLPLRARLDSRTRARRGAQSASDTRRLLRIVVALAGAVVIVALIASASEEPSGSAVEPSGGFAAGRADQWDAAIDVFTEHPLAGAGAEAYYPASAALQGPAPVLYAHSLPLEMTAELGLLGLGLAMLLIVVVFRDAWRARLTDPALLLGPAAAGFILLNLVDWSWHLAAAGAVWAAAAGICATAVSERRRQVPTESRAP